MSQELAKLYQRIYQDLRDGDELQPPEALIEVMRFAEWLEEHITIDSSGRISLPDENQNNNPM